MVFVILTRAGFLELQASFGRLPSPIWVNPDVISEEEAAELRDAGVEITSLGRRVDPGRRSALEDAVRRVQEHHPGERLWVEQASSRQARQPLPRARKTADWKELLQAVVGKADHLFDNARIQFRKIVPSDAHPVIIPYIGYGTPEKLTLTGRVLRDEGLPEADEAATGWQNLVELYKRLASREVPGARLLARFQNLEKQVVADREGYFSVEIELANRLPASGWHTVELELLDPLPAGAKPAAVEGEVLVPPPSARFGVISDIDDTVVWTNVTNKLRMLLMLSRSNAYTRKPFKGIAAFYRALRNGIGGNEGNPFFYVSSSPWNLFTPLVEYLKVQGIPAGPLFLKDYGDHALFASSDHKTHKLGNIKRILEAFPGLQFVLIGDSGEQDPEIYSEVVRIYPGRIRVVYIRNINPDPSRIEAIDMLIEEIRRAGTQLVLCPDSEYAAVHAAGEGLISQSDLASVRVDKKEDEVATAPLTEK